jgi:uncharacterized protein YegL
MTEFIDTNTTMRSYFSKAFTTFNEELYLPNNCLPFEDSKFGLLNLQAISSKPSDIEHEIVLTIDHSGSMDSDSKLEQAIYTLKNIVGYLEENPNIKANVTIFKFDNIFTTVLDRTNVTEDNYKAIEKTINKIRSRGGTNIGLALEETTKYITTLKTMYPTHQISHIFLTDGEVTDGENDTDILKELVNKDIYNYFIGYGSEHDAKLLGILSGFDKSSYLYIDAIEKAGYVFGEILHSITHKVLYDCEIIVENGVIYNYKTNLYTNKLYIGDIIGESNKVYHLFTDNTTNCYVHLKARGNSYTTPLEIHIFQESEHDLNFVNYVFRHRTLTLISEVKECQEKYDNSNNVFDSKEYFSYGNVHDCKLKMKKLFDEMLKYMEDNNDQQNKFIKMLCDDIHISQKTIGTRYGRMCINSRQISQGTQRIYTVNTTPLDHFQHTRQMNYSSNHNVQRGARSFANDSDDEDEDVCQKAVCSFANDSDDEDVCQKASAPSYDPSDDYEVSNNCMVDSPYLTKTATTVMRSISYTPNEQDNEEYNEDEDGEKEKEEDNEDDNYNDSSDSEEDEEK